MPSLIEKEHRHSRKMKLFGVGVLRMEDSKALMLYEAQELSSFGFFQRGTVAEMITFFSKVRPIEHPIRAPL